MRVLLVLKSGKPKVLKSRPDSDSWDYVEGALAVGGTIQVPRENIDYMEIYDDSEIESFRVAFRQAEEAYERSVAMGATAQRNQTLAQR